MGAVGRGMGGCCGEIGKEWKRGQESAEQRSAEESAAQGRSKKIATQLKHIPPHHEGQY